VQLASSGHQNKYCLPAFLPCRNSFLKNIVSHLVMLEMITAEGRWHYTVAELQHANQVVIDVAAAAVVVVVVAAAAAFVVFAAVVVGGKELIVHSKGGKS
jgi:hypothetical protein